MTPALDHQQTAPIRTPVQPVERVEQCKRTGGVDQQPLSGFPFEPVACSNREKRLEVAKSAAAEGVKFGELGGALCIADVAIDEDLEGRSRAWGIAALHMLREGGEPDEMALLVALAYRFLQPAIGVQRVARLVEIDAKHRTTEFGERALAAQITTPDGREW